MMSPKNPVRMNGSEWQNGMFCPNGSDRLKAVWMNRNPLDLGHSSYQVYSPMRHHTIQFPRSRCRGACLRNVSTHPTRSTCFFLAWAWTARNVCSVGCCVDTYIIIYTMHIPKNMYSRLKRAWALQQDQQLQLVSFSRVWIRGGICSLIII